MDDETLETGLALIHELVKLVSSRHDEVRDLDAEVDDVADGLTALMGAVHGARLRGNPVYVHNERQIEDALTVDPAIPQDPQVRELLTVLAQWVRELPQRGQPPRNETAARAARKAEWDVFDAEYERLAVAAGYPPSPIGHGSFWDRRDDPHLLYLVRDDTGEWQKFGHGGYERVRTHRGEVVQVLRARHADVVDAERILIQRHRDQPHPQPATVPASFGSREVVPSAVPIDLAEVLPNGADVTHLFVAPQGGSARLRG